MTGNDLKKLYERMKKRGEVASVGAFAERLGYADRSAVTYYFKPEHINEKVSLSVELRVKQMKEG